MFFPDKEPFPVSSFFSGIETGESGGKKREMTIIIRKNTKTSVSLWKFLYSFKILLSGQREKNTGIIEKKSKGVDNF